MIVKPFALFTLVLVVAGFPVYVLLNRVDPASLSNAQYHEMATRSSSGWSFHEIPRVKRISIEPPRTDVLRTIGDYLQRASRSEGATEAYYDPDANTIFIVGEQACLEATMPRWLRPTFLHTLRHEYGHAMLADWLNAHETPGDPSGTLLAAVQVRRPRAASLPARLRPVLTEYLRGPGETYDEFYMTSFDQYMAESYAGFLDGQYVPPRTARFLREVAARGAATPTRAD